MNNQNDLSQAMVEYWNNTAKQILNKYHKFSPLFFVVLTIIVNFLFNVSYYNLIGGSANLDLTKYNTIIMVLVILFFIVIVFLNNFSALYCLSESQENIFRLYCILKFLMFMCLCSILAIYIFNNLHLNTITNFIDKNFADVFILYISFYFVFEIIVLFKMQKFNIFTITFPYVVIVQDIFLFFSLFLFLEKSYITYTMQMSNTIKICISCLVLFCYCMPIYSISRLRKIKNIKLYVELSKLNNKNKLDKSIIEIIKKINFHNVINFIYSCVTLIFIIYSTAPNLISIAGEDKKIKDEKNIKTIELPPMLIQNLENNFDKFSCEIQQSKDFTCFEKSDSNTYTLRNVLFLGHDDKENKLYCIILPKDDSSTLNNISNDNCSKAILLKDNNKTYIDWKL